MQLKIEIPVLDNPSRVVDWLCFMADIYDDSSEVIVREGGIDQINNMFLEDQFGYAEHVLVLPGYAKNWNHHVFGPPSTENETGLHESHTAYKVIQNAKALNVPVFGICGGAQLVAWSNGGMTRYKLNDYCTGEHEVDVPLVEEYTLYSSFPARFDHGMGIRHQTSCTRSIAFHKPSPSERYVSAFFSAKFPLQGGVQYHPEWEEDWGASKASCFAYEMIRYLSAKRQGLEMCSEEI